MASSNHHAATTTFDNETGQVFSELTYEAPRRGSINWQLRTRGQPPTDHCSPDGPPSLLELATRAMAFNVEQLTLEVISHLPANVAELVWQEIER